jgi:NAD(P)-dependent dehydrogenase (short-subunit alcohol dehydrogenase family)
MSQNFPISGLLKGQLALVTGAASGIGQAIAVAYAQAGARVIVTDRTLQACADTLDRVHAAQADGLALAMDVTDLAAVQAVAGQITQEIGDVTVLVNNAGLLIREGVDSARVHDNLRRMMEVNCFGGFHVLHALLPALRRTRGCVVNIVSGAALSGLAQCVGYSASKGAMKMLTQSMAADLGADGIRVNAIAPGVIDTPMTEATRNNPERLARFLARIPMQRIGQPHEIAGPAVFLASGLASYVNGVTLSVDGGKQAV